MIGKQSKRQAGFALLIFLVVMMGLGGIALTGVTQGILKEIQETRYLHNQRILQEAKQALLQYAYNYPVNNIPARGPGRLPCPDTDNDGSPNPSGSCIATATPSVGRFPWNDPDINFYDARDASGERLWYAVSQNFANFASSNEINSNTTGRITIHDQSGSVMYDGSITGVAAVIIAPGSALGDQDRDADENDSANYLDIFGGLDNSVFINSDPTNGFVVGPIFDGTGSIIVNDQMVLVTADEVTAFAEKSTLDAYKTAINSYLKTFSGLGLPEAPVGFRYPWLNAYSDITDLNIYDVVPGKTVGRVPFLNYYVDHDSHTVVTDLNIDVDLKLTDTDPELVVFSNPTYINAFSAYFNNLDISRSNLSFKQQTFDRSANKGTDNNGTLLSDVDGTTIVNITGSAFGEKRYYWDGCTAGGCNQPEDGWAACSGNADDPTDCARNPAGTAFVPFTNWANHDDIKIRVELIETLYFWDGCTAAGCNQPEDGWEVCPVINGDETDCARNPAGDTFESFTNWNVHDDIKIRVVKLRFDLDAEFEIGFNYALMPGTAPTYTVATAGANARFTQHLDGSVTDLVADFTATTNAEDAVEFIDAISILVCEQDNDVADTANLVILGNDDGGTAPCSEPVMTSGTSNVELAITADYYPEFPLWVKQNNWNDSIMMAYANDYKPGGDKDCDVNSPCLTVTHDYDGLTTNKISLLLGSGSIPADIADLGTIFEGENNTPLDLFFDANPAGGNDTILVLDEN
jgi:hypothetical protein